MTREEEIINAAYDEAEIERQLKMHPQVFEQGFVAGAKWADSHPDNVWRIYNFILAYKEGNFGTIPLHQAIKEYYETFKK